MDAYVINLDKRPDRWQQFQEDWKDTGLNFIRMSAIEHKSGGVGCTRSHLALIQHAKDNNMPYILVLEDDALPTANFKTYWKRSLNYLDNHHSEWNVFNGGPLVVYKNTIMKLTTHFYKTNSALATHFIIYNSNCYDKLLTWETLPESPDKRPIIDAFISWPNLRLITFGVYPFISIQHPGFSDLTKTEINKTSTYSKTEKKIGEFLKRII